MIILYYRLRKELYYMNDKLLNCFTNPIKCKILLEINSQKATTAKHLSEIYTDIPKATLYRYLNKMLKDDILKIVEENPIRGTVEKVYALNFDFLKELKNPQGVSSGKMYMQLFMQYMLGLLSEFKEYTSKEGIDIENDGSGFSLYPVYLSKEELNEFALNFATLLEPYRKNRADASRDLHSIAFIVTPPKTNK